MTYDREPTQAESDRQFRQLVAGLPCNWPPGFFETPGFRTAAENFHAVRVLAYLAGQIDGTASARRAAEREIERWVGAGVGSGLALPGRAALPGREFDAGGDGGLRPLDVVGEVVGGHQLDDLADGQVVVRGVGGDGPADRVGDVEGHADTLHDVSHTTAAPSCQRGTAGSSE